VSPAMQRTHGGLADDSRASGHQNLHLAPALSVEALGR
jgi:hypothetical protein